MINVLFFFCFIYIFQPVVIEDRVDYIEINHVYDEKGLHNTDQLIFWNVSNRKDYKYKYCVDWRLVAGVRKEVTDEENQKLHQIFADAKVDIDKSYRFTEFIGVFIQQTNRGTYFFEFFDKNIMRKVYANSILETWTQYDKEIEHRELQIPEQRMGLSKR